MRTFAALVVVIGAALVACDSDPAGPTVSPTSTRVSSVTPAATTSSPEPTARSATIVATPAAPLDVRFVDEARRLRGEFLLKNFAPATDGGPNELDRALIDDAGAEIQAALHHGDFGDLVLDAWRNIGYPPLVTGGPILVTACATPDATCGGLDFASPRARSTLLRTDDLGASWEPVDHLDRAFYIRAWSTDGKRALLSDQTALDVDVVWPEMFVLTPPARALDLRPVMLPDGRIAWWMRGAGATATWESEARPDLVTEDGEVILTTIDAPVPTSAAPRTVLFHADGSRAVLTWRGARYWTMYDGIGAGAYEQGTTILMPQEFHGTPFTWLTANELLFPVVRDFDDSGPGVLDIAALEAFWLELPPAAEGLTEAPYMPVGARPLGE